MLRRNNHSNHGSYGEMHHSHHGSYGDSMNYSTRDDGPALQDFPPEVQYAMSPPTAPHTEKQEKLKEVDNYFANLFDVEEKRRIDFASPRSGNLSAANSPLHVKSLAKFSPTNVSHIHQVPPHMPQVASLPFGHSNDRGYNNVPQDFRSAPPRYPPQYRDMSSSGYRSYPPQQSYPHPGPPSSNGVLTVILKTVSSFFFKSEDGRNKKQDDTPATIDATLASNDWMSGLLAPQQPQSSSHRPSLNRQPSGSASFNPREGMTVLGLILLLFVGVNLSTLMTAEGEALKDIRKRRPRFGRGGVSTLTHEEGMDRPNSREYLRMMQRGRRPAGAASTPIKQPEPVKLNYNPPPVKPLYNPPPVKPIYNSNPEPPYNPPKQQPVEPVYNPPPPKVEPPPQPQVAVVQPQLGLPPVFNNMSTLPSPVLGTDIPMFWHIPKAGGSSFKEIFGTCMGFTLGCEMGGDPKHASSTSLEVFQVAGRNVVNVDFYNPQGIELGRSLNVASSGKLEMVVSPYLHQSASLFNPQNNGRLFTLLRHPIERAASSYGMYLQQEKARNPASPPMSISDYAKSNRVENNWMVRFLSNKMSGPLENGDLVLAKDILKHKFIVGLLDQKEESLQRFNMYFGWNTQPARNKLDPTERHKCIQRNLAQAPASNKFATVPVKEGSKEYKLLLLQNSFDMELYIYAKQLFQEQRSYFA